MGMFGIFVVLIYSFAGEKKYRKEAFVLFEKIGVNSLGNMGLHLVSVIALDEYVMRQALSNKAVIRLRRDAKDNSHVRKPQESH